MPEQVDWLGQKAQIDAAKAAGEVRPCDCWSGGRAPGAACKLQAGLQVQRPPTRPAGIKQVVIISSMGGTDPSNFLNTSGWRPPAACARCGRFGDKGRRRRRRRRRRLNLTLPCSLPAAPPPHAPPPQQSATATFCCGSARRSSTWWRLRRAAPCPVSGAAGWPSSSTALPPQHQHCGGRHGRRQIDPAAPLTPLRLSCRRHDCAPGRADGRGGRRARAGAGRG